MRAERVAQGPLQIHPLAEKLQERQAIQALRAGGEQAFGGRVGVADNEFVIERDDRRGKQFESRKLQESPSVR